MAELKLDKLFDTNKEYKTEDDKGYKITKIGTDQTSDVTVKIDDRECGTIANSYGPLWKTENPNLGPLDLRKHYYVVPPEKTVEFVGSSGQLVRAVGTLIDLGTGEEFPSDLVSRFGAQDHRYWIHKSGTLDLASGSTFAAGEEKSIFVKELDTKTRWKINYLMGLDLSNLTPAASAGDYSLVIKKDDRPLGLREKEMGRKGIAAMSMPWPARDTVNKIAFKKEENPLVIEPDHKIEFLIRNTSGSDITYTGPSSIVLNMVLDEAKYV